eukprot:TRINITY_DN1264_c0_g1_i1.p1 TRINITY_DN1264_c0_g1~~TRINITY_DN1264_c0_g1_i1.p1  ORF type:complete len:571 (-),score=128.47 TRINITY_DN1264_c0_g1_i1:134-1786(-)
MLGCWLAKGRGARGGLRFYSTDMKKYVSKWNTYRRLEPQFSEENTKILHNLFSSKLKKLSPTLDVIESPGIGKPGDSFPDSLFVRKYYGKILEKIRYLRGQRSILLGNPGVGKSWFQLYYLARIVNPDLYGPLPPDCNGRKEPPQIVIRQIGGEEMEIYFLEARRVERIAPVNTIVLNCFDFSTTLYLMEPGRDAVEPCYSNHAIPTLTTVVPELRHYKEFSKTGKRIYMPRWELEDLEAVGRYAREACPERAGECGEEGIRERYAEFGGIFRYVFPARGSDLEEVRRETLREIEKADPARLVARTADFEDGDVSPYLLQYVVPTESFVSPSLDFVSTSVVEKLADKLHNTLLNDRILLLLRTEKIPGHRGLAASTIFKTIVLDHLTTPPGVEWTRKTINKEGGWEKFKLMVQEKENAFPDSLEEMKEGKMYYSLRKEFPVFDMLMKRKENEKEEVVAFLVHWEKTKCYVIDEDELVRFMGKMGIEIDRLRVVLVTHPKSTDTRLVFKNAASAGGSSKKSGGSNLEENHQTPVDFSYDIWKLPPRLARAP